MLHNISGGIRFIVLMAGVLSVIGGIRYLDALPKPLTYEQLGSGLAFVVVGIIIVVRMLRRH